MPKPKPETIDRALAIAAHLADAKTQQQETVVSAANRKSNSSSTPPAFKHRNNESNGDTIAMAQPQSHQRPPITCHVLDTTTGRPAAGLPVTLSLLSPRNKTLQLSATTNGDGRVAAWTTAEGAGDSSGTTTSLETLFGRGSNSEGTSTRQQQQQHHHDRQEAQEELVFGLRFETGAFWESRGVAAFFPEVEVRFVVRARDEHYHVPLLLGPFNYTTYRGS